MKGIITGIIIVIWIVIIVLAIITFAFPMSNRLTNDSITTYNLPGEAKVVNYYLDPERVTFQYVKTNRNLIIGKSDVRIGLQLTEKQVKDLGINSWTKAGETGELQTLLPNCEYVQVTLARTQNATVSQAFKDIACKNELDYDSTGSTKFQN